MDILVLILVLLSAMVVYGMWRRKRTPEKAAIGQEERWAEMYHELQERNPRPDRFLCECGFVWTGGVFCPRCGREQPFNGPGSYQGRHYIAYTDQWTSLKREGRLEEARDLLLHLVDAVEAEANANKWSLAPAYYRELAIIYGKLKDLEGELAILERYVRAEKYAAKDARLLERLDKVRQKISAQN